MHDWGLGNSVHVRISMSVPLYASARVFAAAMYVAMRIAALFP